MGKIEEHFMKSRALYEELLLHDVAKECARMVMLPRHADKNLHDYTCRSWIHYIELRSANGTQKEHMDLAESCKQIFIEQFPTVSEALEWS